MLENMSRARVDYHCDIKDDHSSHRRTPLPACRLLSPLATKDAALCCRRPNASQSLFIADSRRR